MTIFSGRERSVRVRKGKYDMELAKWGGRQPDTNWISPTLQSCHSGRQREAQLRITTLS